MRFVSKLGGRLGARLGDERMADHLEIDEFEFREDGPYALHTEFPDPGGLAVRPGLRREEREALIVEGEGFLIRGPRSGRKFCFDQKSVFDMDFERIQACRRTVELDKPEWVQRVKDAALLDNTMEKIIRHSEVPPYPAMAILLNLEARGELPGD
jgi:hypothetical protein